VDTELLTIGDGQFVANGTYRTQEELIDAFIAGAEVGAKGGLGIVGDELLSFGWYPIARHVGETFLLRRQMYSLATGVQIKKTRRLLVRAGFHETGTRDEPNRDKWWIYRRGAA
jgi:hypothetical protein